MIQTTTLRFNHLHEKEKIHPGHRHPVKVASKAALSNRGMRTHSWGRVLVSWMGDFPNLAWGQGVSYTVLREPYVGPVHLCRGCKSLFPQGKGHEVSKGWLQWICDVGSWCRHVQVVPGVCYQSRRVFMSLMCGSRVMSVRMIGCPYCLSPSTGR